MVLEFVGDVKVGDGNLRVISIGVVFGNMGGIKDLKERKQNDKTLMAGSWEIGSLRTNGGKVLANDDKEHSKKGKEEQR